MHMIYLSYTDPSTKKEVTTQVVRPLVLGRDNDSDIVIHGDTSISRIHTLAVPRRDGRIEVRDLASSGGTYVTRRGQKMRLMAGEGKDGIEKGRAILFEGEAFFVGTLEVKVHYKELADEPTIDQNYFLEKDEEVTNYK